LIIEVGFDYESTKITLLDHSHFKFPEFITKSMERRSYSQTIALGLAA
jgi:hypothetical protein